MKFILMGSTSMLSLIILLEVRKLAFLKELLKYFSLDNVLIKLAFEILVLIGSWYTSVKFSELVINLFVKY
jgi:hypothetical protein